VSPRARGGFTLLEALLALALSAIVVVAAARALSGTRRAADATSTSADALLARDLGADLLAREVRRAGYVPVPPPPGGAWEGWPASLELTLGAGASGPDAIRVRYVDDRLADALVARDLSFEVAVDGRGDPQLYRVTAGGSKQPLVGGVSGLRISGWADARGLHGRSELVPGAGLRPWLLLLALSARGAERSRTVAVPLPSRPRTAVAAAP